ncbi:hypothetical protein [Emticicia sp. 17c]|uniref:hypothetical protein n=1 Tax=Emticicia sp. 17c TaxID=3127704 RepID=UPI00301DC24F
MKTKIRNIDDLRAERARLKNEISLTKTHLRASIEGIKEELSPARHAVGFLGNFLTNRNKGILNIGVGIGIDTIIRNGILRRAPWPLKWVVPFLLKNYAGNMIQANKDTLVEKGLTWVRNLTDDEPTHKPDEEEYKPSMIEKALMWVKDVTEEKPPTSTLTEVKGVYIEEKPSLVEKALMWVKDVTEEKPKTVKVIHVNGQAPVTTLSE